MVSTTAVKRALAALATRTDTATRPYVAVIDEADAARDDLHRAAGFVDAVGLDRLAAAVDAADRDGDEAAAERGRDALAEYRRFREAAAGTGAVSSPPSRRLSPPGDHFRCAPGTPKPDTRQRSGR
ncbi:hypothetical protein [Halorubrum sp. DTA98]|uniref:hypothetical protein n=1 Tax=Halorubrum sp. DTA98 TaxID=3402163 RepID=UPI003AAFC1AC